MSGSEFQLIQSYFSEPQQAKRPDVLLGIGDDCAIVAPEPHSQLAFSIDTLNCGVHFPLDTPAQAIAHKALSVNLSDLAAMGAKPAWFTLALSLPGQDEWPARFRDQWLRQFSQALFALALQHDIQLIGGDTTHGSLSITIQITGYLEAGRVLQRSGAQVGDIIAVTGKLGAAALGLDLLLGKHPKSYQGLTEADRNAAVKALNYPQARLKEGAFLAQLAHSALDISDGLLADLGHILKASGVGARLQLQDIPLADSLLNVAPSLAWQKALAGGDDYELCFTLAQKNWSEVQQRFPQCIAIGHIVQEKSLVIFDLEGREYNINNKGYDHFSL